MKIIRDSVRTVTTNIHTGEKCINHQDNYCDVIQVAIVKVKDFAFRKDDEYPVYLCRQCLKDALKLLGD